MRILAFLLAVSPSLAFADTIPAPMAPTDVTIFPMGAEVTRKGQITLPAGTHDIVIEDLRPSPQDDKTPSITLTGARIISQKWQNKIPKLAAEPNSDAYKKAKAALEQAKAALNTRLDAIAAQKQIKSAAKAQIEFLAALPESKTLPDGVDSLRDLSRMIMEETLSARTAIQQAEIKERDLQEDIPELKQALTLAQHRLDALKPPSDAFAQLTLTVTVPEATTGDLTVKYLTQKAGWKPVYDLHLNTSGTPELIIKRGAVLAQETGEHWRNVNVTLSTRHPGDHADPSQIHPMRLNISDKEALAKRSMSVGQYSDAPEALALEPMVMEETVSMDLSGISAEYHLEYPVDINSDQNFSRFALGALEFDATVFARAIPTYDKTAYRMVSFTNTSGERLLPAQAELYIDGRLVTETFVEQIVPNAEAELGFGPIHGLRLTRNILKRNEGDRGLISRSNETTERLRIDVENLTGENWEISLLDRVPYAEQEDLSIQWSASPRPDTVDYEDQRGILQWNMDVAAGATRSITMETKITWPDGMILR